MVDRGVIVPVALVLFSSLCFAAQLVFTSVALRSASPRAVLWISTTTNLAGVLLWALWSAMAPISARAFLVLIVAGIFAPMLGRVLQVTSLTRLGSNIATPILMTYPVFTVLLAMIWFGERPGMIPLVGGLLVVAGSLAVASEWRTPQNADSRLRRIGSQLWLPVLGSASYGVSMILRKDGLSLGADPVTAALLTVAPSWFGYTAYFVSRRQHGAFSCSPRSALVLVGVGAVGTVAIVLWHAAIQMSTLALTAPLAATTPIFALLLSYLFMRDHEVFTRRIVLGSLAAVVGVAVMTFGTP